MKITQQVWEFSEPVVKAHGCSIWDVEYVREGGEWFLRLYIDKDGSDHTGVEGSEIRLATETSTPGTYYTNVAYSVVSGTVKVLVVEVDNNFSDVTM